MIMDASIEKGTMVWYRKMASQCYRRKWYHDVAVLSWCGRGKGHYGVAEERALWCGRGKWHYGVAGERGTMV